MVAVRAFYGGLSDALPPPDLTDCILLFCFLLIRILILAAQALLNSLSNQEEKPAVASAASVLNVSATIAP